MSQYFLQDLPAGMHVQQAHVPVAHKRPSKATRTSLLFIWRTANRGKTLPHCTATSHRLHATLKTSWVYSSDTCATVCVDDSDWSVLGAGLNVGDSDWLGFPGNFNFLTTELQSINPTMFTKPRWCVLSSLFLCVLILSPGSSLGTKLKKKRCRICKDFVESFEKVSLQIIKY